MRGAFAMDNGAIPTVSFVPLARIPRNLRAVRNGIPPGELGYSSPLLIPRARAALGDVPERKIPGRKARRKEPGCSRAQSHEERARAWRNTPFGWAVHAASTGNSGTGRFGYRCSQREGHEVLYELYNLS